MSQNFLINYLNISSNKYLNIDTSYKYIQKALKYFQILFHVCSWPLLASLIFMLRSELRPMQLYFVLSRLHMEKNMNVPIGIVLVFSARANNPKYIYLNY